jgi:hypothetical protein
MAKKLKAMLWIGTIIFICIWAYNVAYPRIGGHILLTYYPEIKDFIGGRVIDGTEISLENTNKIDEFLKINKAIKTTLSLLISIFGAFAINLTISKKLSSNPKMKADD